AREHCIAGHHPGQRGKRVSVSIEACRHELSIRGFTDVWQAIVRLYNLPRPAVSDLGSGKYPPKCLFESPVAAFRVGLLAGFVIVAAEYDSIEFSACVDSQVVIRIARVPQTDVRLEAAR